MQMGVGDATAKLPNAKHGRNRRRRIVRDDRGGGYV